MLFLFGFLSNELKLKNVHTNISYAIDKIENYFNFSLKKNFGDRYQRNFLNNSRVTSDNNFNIYNKPNKEFDDYLLIKHDHTPIVLMKSPDKIVWTWNLSSFRNITKIIPFFMYPNGDLIIGNYEKKGIYRIDKNGQIIWKINKINHHWADVYNDKIFIPSRKFINLPNDLNNKLLLNSLLKNCKTKNSIFDTILIIDAKNGRTIDEINLMDKLLSEKKFSKILNENYKLDKNLCKDPLHLNDIQVVNDNNLKYLKQSLPNLKKGNLILSFRSINSIIFYDYKESKVKHILYNLFDKQHSPRINKDGFLYVFDNNPNGKKSKIVKIDLKNNKIASVFENNRFKSDVRGRIQFFKNKLFVQSSTQGEIFEIKCENEFFNNCEQNYIYSANFSYFYPSNLYDTSETYKKDAIYLADFYEKKYVKFLE